MEALLALEDGTIFQGRSFGAKGTCFGEVVFNTGMTGYPEILTDPSYRGQMVAMTYPLIGNYGIAPEDFESRSLFLSGFIVKEVSRRPSNFRSRLSLPELLEKHKIIGIEGLDTRKLVKHIRLAGAMKGAISTDITDAPKLIAAVHASPGLIGRDCVSEVAIEKPYAWNEGLPDVAPEKSRFKVCVMDYGVKYNILRHLVSAGCKVKVFPAYAKAEAVLREKPDGIFLSNGPGDPAALPRIVEEVKNMLGKAPIFGICLGQQLLGQAFGGKTYKLRFGHHGCNQPVLDMTTRKVEITSQNHGFCVDAKTLPADQIEVTHINLNDQTAEGLAHRKLPIFSVQYHPEAGPGPHDSRYLFKRFTEMMGRGSWRNTSS